jgi:predicted tellurium resistance membrane protein TerC
VQVLATSELITNPLLWGGFVVFVLLAMVVDLGVSRRSHGVMGTRAAMTWSVVWISTALCFNVFIWHTFGSEKAEEFLAGYLLEKSLSVDNLFVFVLVFAYFRTPPHQQHRVLVWGIIGAMLLRALMIGAGAVAIQQFHYTLAFFGLFLVYTGIKLLGGDDEDEDPSDSRLVRLIRRFVPLTPMGESGDGKAGEDAGSDAEAEAAEPGDGYQRLSSARHLAAGYNLGYRENHFFVHEGGRWKATTLFLVLLVIECSDVIFAVDSIPAIFGVTQDPFIVFTSNIFAILGLRALFFVIANAIQRLKYLNYGLSIVLSFIGVKMILPFLHELVLRFLVVDLAVPFLGPGLHVSTFQSLAFICLTLGSTAVLSLVTAEGEEPEEPGEPGGPGGPGEAAAAAEEPSEPAAEASPAPEPSPSTAGVAPAVEAASGEGSSTEGDT